MAKRGPDMGIAIVVLGAALAIGIGSMRGCGRKPEQDGYVPQGDPALRQPATPAEREAARIRFNSAMNAAFDRYLAVYDACADLPPLQYSGCIAKAESQYRQDQDAALRALDAVQ